MPTRWIIGLSSGSSASGVEAALVECEGAGLDLRVRLLHHLHQPYGKDLRELIRRVSGPAACEPRQAALLHRLLGETFAAAARQVADRASFSLQRVFCLICPGHTVWHEPEGRFPSTLPLGMAAVVAERTGITTLGDLRSRDLAAGGQGGPLGALADFLLLRHPQENRAILHLGGITRVVYLPAGGRLHETLAFEAGPGTGLLDALMRQVTAGREACDPGGRHAVQGCCQEALLARWRAHPYLLRRPPKTLPRHVFADDFAAQAVQQARQNQWPLHDLLCTATHFIAHGAADALRRFLPGGGRLDRVLISGGGARNGFLWHLLEQDLGGTPLERTDRAGLPADARKAVAFAVLGALTFDGVPITIPAATGAAGSRLVGSLTPGSPGNWARCLAWMAAQTALLVHADAG